jgi:hypothetical protein
MFATKQDFTDVLKNNVCRVVFRKKDSSERVMYCTLQHNVIESNGLTPNGTGPIVPDNQVRCIDTNLMEWRSFNIDTVLQFEVV